MHNVLWFLRFALFSIALSAFCDAKSAKLSEALGHLIGKNLQSIGISFDAESLVKGMRDEASGLPSPLSEEECMQVLTVLEEKAYGFKKEENLQKAEIFLSQNKTNEGVQILEGGKVQFEVLKQGNGDTVLAYHSPLVRYKGSFLNGESFGSDEEEIIVLDEAIPGLRVGISGMKEGEVRKLYVHPELGFGQEERLYPNALVIFEVEVLRADVSSEAHAASNASDLPLRPVLEHAFVQ